MKTEQARVLTRSTRNGILEILTTAGWRSESSISINNYEIKLFTLEQAIKEKKIIDKDNRLGQKCTINF